MGSPERFDGVRIFKNESYNLLCSCEGVSGGCEGRGHVQSHGHKLRKKKLYLCARIHLGGTISTSGPRTCRTSGWR
jgi:hypothetical protein